MIIEDYVSFETAELLKEKGFDEYCWHYYDVLYGEPAFVDTGGRPYNNAELLSNEYTAPTIQMAMKWLREVHHLHCQIDCPAVSPIWQYGIYNLRLKDWLSTKMMGNFNTYEHAAETAIKYCLENLI